MQNLDVEVISARHMKGVNMTETGSRTECSSALSELDEMQRILYYTNTAKSIIKCDLCSVWPGKHQDYLFKERALWVTPDEE